MIEQAERTLREVFGLESFRPGFGVKAGAELDRYLRARASHPRYRDRALFIGQYGGLTSNAVYQLIERRARQAGLPRLWPHQLRHLFADSWKRAEANYAAAIGQLTSPHKTARNPKQWEVIATGSDVLDRLDGYVVRLRSRSVVGRGGLEPPTSAVLVI